MLITNATVVNWTPRQIDADQAVLVQGDRIVDIGASADLTARYPDEQQYDARGRLIMPGNICAHTHFYGAFARGMAIPGPAPRDFPEILRRLWWPLDKSLTAADIRASALVCLIDAIKHGTTTLIDHHASPNAIDGSLDVIANAVDQAGMRAVLCYEVTDRDGEAKAEAGIAENVRFLRASESRPLVAGTFGLHASMTVSDATLHKCVEANAPFGGGFHIHVAEHEYDEEDSLLRSGVRVVRRLQRAGILGPRTITAHAVHVDPWEMDILRDTETWVTHQPRSNMNNGVGAAPFDHMAQGGIKLCLGNDGFSNDMFAEWKAAYLLHKVAHRDPRRANGNLRAQVATDHNAALAEMFFGGQTIGSLAAGAAADMILVDYHPFTPLTGDNLPWHVLFGFESSMVTATLVAGRVLMWDRQLTTLDEAAVAAEARALAPGVWARYHDHAMALV
ncbi:MAG: putative aminohydrolase SsnA [Chloroflexi bacterium]|nr:MAG: putative aminohydrolase SsnA [Chloroflexota bacterium]